MGFLAEFTQHVGHQPVTEFNGARQGKSKYQGD
jgi:hypothetical protein